MITSLVLSTIILALLLGAMVVIFRRRKRDEQRGAARLKLAVAEGQTIPLSLHPVIDPVLCVGSFSCTKACPEGEVIGVVDGVATLVEAAHCIGHARCAVECPVGAIKLVFGTAEIGIHLPKADESFESSREGVYIVGELGGMGLIKNALRQGLVLGKTLKQRLKKSEATETLTDVVVVGGGPAGIATAVALRQHGLDVRILEQDTLGGAIAHYPRGKVVMTEQIEMPGFGRFGKPLLSKEELLRSMRELVENNGILIEEGHKVVAIDGDAPILSVMTQNESVVQCRAVVLAIGLRGTPRKLGVPGEDQVNVVYRLVEPEQYHKKRVLVVGGGDSAVEAAIQLAEESTAKVTISYRQEKFARCKTRNKEKIKRLIDEGRVRALMKTRVLSIEDGVVRLSPALDAKEEEIARKRREVEEAAKKEIKRDIEPEPDITDPAGLLPKVEVTDPLGAFPPAMDVDDAGPLMPTDPISPNFAELTIAAEKQRGKGDNALPFKRTATASFKKSGAIRKAPKSVSLPRPAPLPPPKSSLLAEAPDTAPPVGDTEPIPFRSPTRAAPVEASAATRMREPKREPSKSERREVSKREAREASRSQSRGSNTSIRVSDRIRTIEGATTSTASSVKTGSPKVDRDEIKLKNDAVIVSIGGQLPTEFLEGVGVGTRRYHGEEKSGFEQRPGKKGTSKAEVEARSRRRLALTLFLFGLSMIVGLVLIGREYYWLPADLRSQSPLHSLLKPSGLWGHGVGVGATTFMLANFVYALRKRWRLLKGTASIRTWLTLHMFVGIMSPLVIAFHAAFLLNNLLAVWTWIALSVVVGTGIFGRFLFGFVPAQAGKVLQVSELREQVGEMTRVIQTHMAESADFGKVNTLFDRVTDMPRERTFVGTMVRDQKARRNVDRSLDEAKKLFKDEQAFNLYKETAQNVAKAKMQIQFHGSLKRVFRGWLVIHVVISIFMVVLIGAHVGVTTYLGFRWIFSGASP